MKTIELYDVYYFLKQCEGVLLEGRFLKPTLSEIEDDYSNEFLTLEWEEFVTEEDVKDGEEEGEPGLYQVSVGFKEGDNQTVGLEGAVLTLTNTDGEEEELTLLQEWHPFIK